MKIEDLSKEELISYIYKQVVQIEERDLKEIRFDLLTRRASALAKEAIDEMDKARGIRQATKFLKALHKFDEALGIHKEAAKLLE